VLKRTSRGVLTIATREGHKMNMINPVSEVDQNILNAWLYRKHFEQLTEVDTLTIISHYLGIYSSQPTSWEAILARNPQISKLQVIDAENSGDLIRVPGMRRSKFLMPLDLGEMIFSATRLDISKHEWRLREVGLSVDDYQAQIPSILELTKNTSQSQRQIAKQLNIKSELVRAMIQVALYQGFLLRVPSDNEWSNLWQYQATPKAIIAKFDTNQTTNDSFYKTIANQYVENYGPISTKDLAWWLDISQKQAKQFLTNSDECEISEDYWLSKHELNDFLNFKQVLEDETIRFLPAWDPLLMGYAPQSQARMCFGLEGPIAYDQHGNGKPVIMIGNRCVANWYIKKDKKERQLFLEIDALKSNEREKVRGEARNWAVRIGAKLVE
jgi:DNA-binding MarR family transcriptional regulator